jgi:hypothetical protein
MSLFKVLVIVALVPLVFLYLHYGTLEPCGMLRETVRQHDKIAAHLPDSLVDWQMEMQYGPLSPGRCVALLADATDTSPVQPITAKPQTSTSTQPQVEHLIPPQQFLSPQQQAERIKRAGNEAVRAMIECRNKRLSGELKTFVESVNCSNPKFVAAYHNAHYPYMDLIGLITAKRLEVAEKIDEKKLTEGQAQLENAEFMVHVVNIERQRNLQSKN